MNPLRPLRGAVLAVVDGDRVALETPGVLAPRGAVLYLAAEVRS